MGSGVFGVYEALLHTVPVFPKTYGRRGERRRASIRTRRAGRKIVNCEKERRIETSIQYEEEKSTRARRRIQKHIKQAESIA